MERKQLRQTILAIFYLLTKEIIEAIKLSFNNFMNLARGGGTSDYAGPVYMIIGGIIWVVCIPIYVTQVQNTNTTGWSFTGSAGAITLFLLMPFVLIAGGVVWILRKALKG